MVLPTVFVNYIDDTPGSLLLRERSGSGICKTKGPVLFTKNRTPYIKRT